MIENRRKSYIFFYSFFSFWVSTFDLSAASGGATEYEELNRIMSTYLFVFSFSFKRRRSPKASLVNRRAEVPRYTGQRDRRKTPDILKFLEVMIPSASRLSD